MANRWVNSGNIDRFCFGETPESLQLVTAAMKLKKTNKQKKQTKKKTLASWKKSYDQPRQHSKK